MNKVLIHSIVLVLTVFIAFLFEKSYLAKYELQFVAALFIILYIKKKFLSKTTEKLYRGESRLLESTIFTLVIVGIVNTTGGTLSPYFFLIYFLLFSLSLILEPTISFLTSLVLATLFLIDAPKKVELDYYIPIFSLLFLTPFSVFIGNQYLRSQSLQNKAQELTRKITRTKEDTLLFLSLMLKNHLKKIKEAADNFTGEHQISEIKESAHKMERLIDKFEGEI